MSPLEPDVFEPELELLRCEPDDFEPLLELDPELFDPPPPDGFEVLEDDPPEGRDVDAAGWRLGADPVGLL